MSKRLMERCGNIETITDLHKALEELTVHGFGNVTYVRSSNGNNLLLELEEETLTDGSIVYNVIVREIQPFSSLNISRKGVQS